MKTRTQERYRKEAIKIMADTLHLLTTLGQKDGTAPVQIDCMLTSIKLLQAMSHVNRFTSQKRKKYKPNATMRRFRASA